MQGMREYAIGDTWTLGVLLFGIYAAKVKA